MVSIIFAIKLLNVFYYVSFTVPVFTFLMSGKLSNDIKSCQKIRCQEVYNFLIFLMLK